MSIIPQDADLISKFFQFYTKTFDSILGMIDSDHDQVKKKPRQIEKFIISDDWGCLKKIIESSI